MLLLALGVFILLLIVARTGMRLMFNGMLSEAEKMPLLPAHDEDEQTEGFCSKCGASLVQEGNQFETYWQANTVNYEQMFTKSSAS